MALFKSISEISRDLFYFSEHNESRCHNQNEAAQRIDIDALNVR